VKNKQSAIKRIRTNITREGGCPNKRNELIDKNRDRETDCLKLTRGEALLLVVATTTTVRKGIIKRIITSEERVETITIVITTSVSEAITVSTTMRTTTTLAIFRVRDPTALTSTTSRGRRCPPKNSTTGILIDITIRTQTN